MNEPKPETRSDSAEEHPASLLVSCWRCRKMVPSAAPRCPFCSATLAAAPDEPLRARTATPRPPLVSVLIAFSAMLLVSVVHGLVLGLRQAASGEQRPPGAVALPQILIVEFIDTLVVAAVWYAISVSRHPSPWQRRWAAWPLAWLGLVGMLGINLAYHRLLRQLFAGPGIDSLLGVTAATLPWWFLALCIQPAFVEELFFRRLAVDALRPVLSGHGAVAISSLMFALAHVGTPLSMPVLLLLGILLGYARWYSGGLLLPILLHFVHNLVVLLLEFRP